MRLAIVATLLVSAAAFFIKPDRLDIGKAAKGAAAAGVAFFLIASPAFAGDAEAGQQIFNANCASCHAGGKNIIMREKTLKKEALDQFLAGGRNEGSVVTLVTNGKGAMPAYGRRLSDDDTANVATYVIATSEAGWE